MPHRQPPVEHQFKKGQVANPTGRPKDSLKVYLRRKLTGMTEEEKEKWIKEIPKELQWRMSEGNPETKTNTKFEGDLKINVINYSSKKKKK